MVDSKFLVDSHLLCVKNMRWGVMTALEEVFVNVKV